MISSGCVKSNFESQNSRLWQDTLTSTLLFFRRYLGLDFYTHGKNKLAETQERKPQVLNEDSWVTEVIAELPND